MMRPNTKLLCLLVALALAIGLSSGLATTAYADSVSYKEASYNSSTGVTYTYKTVDATPITDSTTTLSDGGWYVVNSNVEVFTERITVTGTANLILADDKTLTAYAGINVSSGNTLNIYHSRSGSGTGTLNASGGDNQAGIGGGNTEAGGTVNIHGGNVRATGGDSGAGIGGGSGGAGSTVTIYGGDVTAKGGTNAAGIGGGNSGAGSDVTIYGGDVTAKGGSSSAQGIGYGNGGNTSGNITVSEGCSVFGSANDDDPGSQIEEYNNDDSANRKQYMMVRSPASIPYVELTFDATTGKVISEEKTVLLDSAKILDTDNPSTTWEDGGWYVVNIDVEVTDRITVSGTANLILKDGATLTADKGISVATDADGDNPSTLNIYAQSDGAGKLIAKGDENYSGIGGYKNDDSYYGGNVNIHGGTIEATGGTNAAGIGGGGGGAGGTVTIYGGTVNATGGEKGAGIGGGRGQGGGKVTIYSGTVNANGNDGSAGIGGGGGGDENGGATVEIYGGTVNATGGEFGAGIGGGETGGGGGTVTISGGTVNATGDNAAGIGGGSEGGGGTVTISGGTINANGHYGGAGIGGGPKGSGGEVTINGGKVTANGGSAYNYYEVEAQGIGRGSYDDDAPGIGSLTIGEGFVVFSGGSTKVITNYSDNREQYMQVEKGYTVSFDKNLTSGVTGTMDIHGARASSSYNLTLPENSFLRTGYNLKSWNIQADGSGTSYADKASVTLTANITLYAQWEAITYTIAYELQSGTVATPNPATYTIETETFTLTNPTRTGYTFTGWTGSADVTSSKDVQIPLGSIGNRSYTANWSINTYQISFTLDGGTLSGGTTSYNVETAVSIPQPTKAGYEFTGWTGTGLTAASTDLTVPVGSTENRNYTATWKVAVYNITYALNDGTVSTANPATYTIETTTFTLTNPTRTGYTFTGWTGTNLSAASTAITIAKGSTGDRAYTANWTAIIYALSYDLVGGTVSPENPKSYTVESPDIKLTRPIKLGYDFTGWSFDNQISLDVTIPKGSTEDREYVATWGIIAYTIGYDLQDGTVSSANPTSYNVETTTFALTNPSRESYTFDGWTGTGLSDKTQTVTIAQGSTGERSYTANFTPITYTLTYELNGGTNASGNPSSYTIETATITLQAPTKAGYEFSGWTLDGETITEITTGSTGNKTLTALWTAADTGEDSSSGINVEVGTPELSVTSGGESRTSIKTVFTTSSGNAILTANLAITTEFDELQATVGTSFDTTVSVDVTLDLADTSYTKYAYSLDLTGLPEWLKVSGELASSDSSVKSAYHHECGLTGTPSDSLEGLALTLRAVVKIFGASSSSDLICSVDKTITLTSSTSDCSSETPENSGGNSGSPSSNYNAPSDPGNEPPEDSGTPAEGESNLPADMGNNANPPADPNTNTNPPADSGND